MRTIFIHFLNSGDLPFNADTNVLRLQLAKHAVSVYSVESALYMTTGLMDIYENTDVNVETSILKVFLISLLLH